MKYKLSILTIIVFIVQLACWTTTTVTEIPATPIGPDSIGTIERVSDTVNRNQGQVTELEDLFQNDSLHMFGGGEGLLDFGSGMRLRMFNDTELGGVRTASDPETPLVVQLTLFSGGFSGQLFREGSKFEFDTPNGGRIHVFGTTFVVVYDPDQQITLGANFEGDMRVESAGSQLISIPEGNIYAVLPDEEPFLWGEIPWTPAQYDAQARANLSPLIPFDDTLRIDGGAAAGPTDTPPPTACPMLAVKQFEAQVDPETFDRFVYWNAVGGCGPYKGTLTAQYEDEGAPYDVFQISDRTGIYDDFPPSRCEGTFNIIYTLILIDDTGQEVTATTSMEVIWIC
jgi:hypothetical protein